MTIDKAIEELNDLQKVGLNRLTPDEKDAVKLGEEALKRFKEQRQDLHSRGFYRLPGETED